MSEELKNEGHKKSQPLAANNEAALLGAECGTHTDISTNTSQTNVSQVPLRMVFFGDDGFKNGFFPTYIYFIL